MKIKQSVLHIRTTDQVKDVARKLSVARGFGDRGLTDYITFLIMKDHDSMKDFLLADM